MSGGGLKHTSSLPVPTPMIMFFQVRYMWGTETHFSPPGSYADDYVLQSKIHVGGGAETHFSPPGSNAYDDVFPSKIHEMIRIEVLILRISKQYEEPGQIRFFYDEDF